MSSGQLFTGEDVTAALDDRVATVTLGRPPVNALRTQTWRELQEALSLAARADRTSVIVLRSGVGGIFSAGADVNELPMTPEVDHERQELTRTVLRQLMDAPTPTVAAIDGPALGGACALVCAADIRIGTPGTRFGLPEINVGRCGGGSHLMRHLPQGTVRLLYFTGDHLEAEEAARLGLLNVVVDDLEAGVDALARRIAAKSPNALRLAKQALNLAEPLEVQRGYEVEQQFSLRLAGTADAAEAASAFREKRPPVWASDEGRREQ